MSPLRHWSVLHSDFLADCCWAEDSWLMMLDSPFGCALDIHTGAYPPFSEIPICYWTAWLSLFMVIEMFGCSWQTLYCALDYPHWGIFPSPWWDCVWTVVRGWMIVVSLFASRLRRPISILGHIPLSITRFIWVVIWGWMISVGWLAYDFDVRSYTGAYFPHFLWVSLRLRQWPAWF